jgi:hypothetical protein
MCRHGAVTERGGRKDALKHRCFGRRGVRERETRPLERVRISSGGVLKVYRRFCNRLARFRATEINRELDY